MISLIEFITYEPYVVLPEDIIDKFRLSRVPMTSYNIGIGLGEKELKAFPSYYKDINELTQKTENDEILFFDSDGKKVESYSVFTPYKGPINYFACDRSQLVNLADFALNWTLNPYKIIRTVQETSALAALEKIEDKYINSKQDLSQTNETTFNKRCNVHIGGGIITTYNQVLLIEDCCTDTLQKHLSSGWRIIAVCVQPNQRRPDYVVGRYNPEN